MSLFDLLRRRQQKVAVDAMTRYREILGRHENPKKDDAEILLGLDLGFDPTPERLIADVKVMRRAAELAKRVEGKPAAIKARDTTAAEAEAHAKETDKILEARQGKQRQLNDVASQANVAVMHMEAIESDIASLKRDHPKLLDWDRPPEEFVGPPAKSEIERQAMDRAGPGGSAEDRDRRVQDELVRLSIEKGAKRGLPLSEFTLEGYANMMTSRRRALLERDARDPDAYNDPRNVEVARTYLKGLIQSRRDQFDDALAKAANGLKLPPPDAFEIEARKAIVDDATIDLTKPDFPGKLDGLIASYIRQAVRQSPEIRDLPIDLHKIEEAVTRASGRYPQALWRARPGSPLPAQSRPLGSCAPPFRNSDSDVIGGG